MQEGLPKVLLVDDDDICLDILEEVLSEDFRTYRAMSGEEALLLAPTIAPQAILLDINMTGIDGYETCQRIRANESLNKAKIIMVSAATLKQEKAKGMKAGADEYLTKPFNLEQLLKTVKNQLGK